MSATQVAPVLAPVGPLTPGDMGYSTMPAGLDVHERHAYRKGFTRGAALYARKNASGQAIGHNPLAGDVAPAAGTAARRQLAVSLAAMGKAFRAERHETAHKAGMSDLRSYWKRHGLTDRAARYAPVRAPRKTATRKTVAPVVAVDVTESAAPSDSLTAAAVSSGHLSVVRVSDQPEAARRISDRTYTDPRCAPLAPEAAPVAPVSEDSESSRAAALVTAAGDAIPAPVHGRRATRRAVAALLRSHGIAPAGASWLAACDAAGLGEQS